jgi:CheY-like chemotaxis protein
MIKNAYHILLAEDEANTRLSISIILRKAGFRVTAARHGLEAIRQIQNLERAGLEQVDLLVVDIEMPELSGLEVIRKLRRDMIDIPFMVITGYGNRELINQINQLGCIRIIQKPFEPTELQSVIREYLNVHAAAAEVTS